VMPPAQKPSATQATCLRYSWLTINDGVKRRYQACSFGLLQMQIDHRCFQFAVPKKFLDGVDVGARVEKMSGKGMAQGVGGIILPFQPNHFYIALYKMLDASFMHRLSLGLPFKQIHFWPVVLVIIS